MNEIKGYGYFLEAPQKPLERREFVLPTPQENECIVEVAGCGLCHTDISFFSGLVGTKQKLPLVLGHEISGKVIASGERNKNLIGKSVIVPAVLPCGECDLCKDGRDNICQQQKMPGNDFNGGFASHLTVPGRFLCELPTDLNNFSVSDLSVVADAVTTPYQALLRSNLKEGELAIVIGVGGIGIHMVGLAKMAGATVISLDIDDEKLKVAENAGSSYVINSKNLNEKEVKNAVRTIVKENKLPRYRWRVFETSGTSVGQKMAFSFLSFAGSVGIVGFTMDKVEVRLSNIMAFDADVFGNWGCSPAHYKTVVDYVLSGKIPLSDYIEKRPLDSINEIIPMSQEHKLKKRIIFEP